MGLVLAFTLVNEVRDRSNVVLVRESNNDGPAHIIHGTLHCCKRGVVLFLQDVRQVDDQIHLGLVPGELREHFSGRRRFVNVIETNGLLLVFRPRVLVAQQPSAESLPSFRIHSFAFVLHARDNHITKNNPGCFDRLCVLIRNFVPVL